jgi:hypothetical protein
VFVDEPQAASRKSVEEEEDPITHFTISDVQRPSLAAEAMGIRKEAKKKTLADAYHKGVRKHHPDKGGRKSHFQVLREAYSVLLADNAERS